VSVSINIFYVLFIVFELFVPIEHILFVTSWLRSSLYAFCLQCFLISNQMFMLTSCFEFRLFLSARDGDRFLLFPSRLFHNWRYSVENWGLRTYKHARTRFRQHKSTVPLNRIRDNYILEILRLYLLRDCKVQSVSPVYFLVTARQVTPVVTVIT